MNLRSDYTLELTLDQLRSFRISKRQLTSIFNSCEGRIESTDEVTVKIVSQNGMEKECKLNVRNSVVDELRKKLPTGNLKFGGELINDEDTGEVLGIENGATLYLVPPMTQQAVKNRMDEIVQELEFRDVDDNDPWLFEDSDEDDYDHGNEYYTTFLYYM